ncbi:E3 ubiquitin-protein ligase hel2 isoform X3 [Beta vulgaris subsp. vulgaris]|uniref:E3 ubiquitin-protein ligase hel2 isoform X3 n=1 Tax=Beta vulgaris subsp. vulgaris TaxID=3555 RepID=UPI0020367A08|nr:E3 ubiquitin-protein ligase hel2 isoform X3 [Beta vulgaris subsp. vulgaris]
MDDGSCAVCAETLEWVAYGACGHKDVCAICIARLRFVCDDRRCCICKSLSSSVFVTRALGSLTRVINDFSVLPVDAKDGKVGSYWFHEDTQAYFDDFDAYKIIKAMCRLSCNVCDKLEAVGNKKSKKRGKFKSVEQLKDHFSRQHELFFCNLCLEYKKQVFMSEQKLYSRVQLRQHIRYGDSEVDGSENERCGFSGHPLCEFCQIPFYGDNELYFHMSTGHYTCHICQRQHFARFDYYKDYNDLENHFREDHFLCEDDTCLEKKFVVFLTEADMKRHSALEHGENMSRSKRKIALQLHTGFRHQGREEEGHRVRAHVSFSGASNLQLVSTSSVYSERASSNRLHDTSSVVQAIPGPRRPSEISATAISVPSSGQLQGATLDFRSVLLSDSDFPSLPKSSKRRRRKSKKLEEIGTSHTPAGSPSQCRSLDAGYLSHSRPSISPLLGPLAVRHSSSSSANSYNLLTSLSDGNTSAGSTASRTDSIEAVGPSTLAPKLINEGSVCPSTSKEGTLKEDDIRAANKSLVGRISASLEFDKDKYAAFKLISQEFREGEIDAGEYFGYIHQFGLAHLISDLARLCPDQQKQKELMKIYKSSLGDTYKIGLRKECGKTTVSKHSKKGKEKCEDSSISGKEKLPDSIANHFKELKLNAKTPKEEPPSSKLKHLAKGKSQASVEDVGHPSGGGSCNSSGPASTGGKKKKKKQLKFLKTRLDESSASVVEDLSCCDLASDLMVVRPDQDSILASVRGVWRNNGGRRLVTMSQASPSYQ